MKHLFIALCTSAFLSLSIQAQEQIEEDSIFRMTLELVKPNGKVDNSSYFLLTIINKTNDEFRLFPGENTPSITKHSLLYPQLMRADGTIRTNKDDIYLYREDTPASRLIASKASYKQRIPLFYQIMGSKIVGILPPKGVENYNKVRIELYKLTAINLSKPKLYTANLYSNWIDISKEDFSKIRK